MKWVNRSSGYHIFVGEVMHFDLKWPYVEEEERVFSIQRIDKLPFAWTALLVASEENRPERNK